MASKGYTPNIDDLDWFAERLDPDQEKPFVGYNAAVAIAQAARSLPHQADGALEQAIKRALALAERNTDDPPRIMVLNTALSELKAKPFSELYPIAS